MANQSQSDDEKSLDTILSWYDDQVAALLYFKNKIVDVVVNSDQENKIDAKFIDLTLNDLNEYFTNSVVELEYLVCFDLISATEALLRLDYNNRDNRKDKSSIGRIFRIIDRKKGNKISLEEDILEAWKDETNNGSFSHFSGILKYRHWLAHGRYWKPKLGRFYTVDNAFVISYNILKTISV